MSRPARFILLGTGSSGGVPRTGGDWGDCDPSEPRNRRRRCSALLEFGVDRPQPTRVLFDTAPDLREQLNDASIDRIDAIVYTHDHADQTHGIDDVRSLVLRQRAALPTFMDAATRSRLTHRFAYCFEGAGGYPPILALEPDIAPYHPFAVHGPAGAVELLPLDMQHGNIRCMGYRMGGLAYCNDVNGLPDTTMARLQGLDVFIIDALRYTPHPTHAHLEMTLGWVAALRPRRTILTNLHIDMDYQTLRKALPEGVEPGYDGQVIDLAI